MKKLANIVLAALALAGCGNEDQCRQLAQTAPPGTHISRAEWRDGNLNAEMLNFHVASASQERRAPPHCLIEGEINPRTGADGKHYGIRFQLRLPQGWNGRFLFQGGQEFNGFVDPAVGHLPLSGASGPPALMRGYAVASTDGGHPSAGPEFGGDQQARLDYAYRSIGAVTAVAKALINRYYRRPPAHSTFMGCSNGGREALMAAQHYPLEFDGIIAITPALNFSRALMGQLWDYRQLLALAPTNGRGEPLLARALSHEDMDRVSAAVLAHCDGRDGREDGVINHWESCDFSAEKAGLGPEKTAALQAIMAGARDSRGNAIYSGWHYDRGLNSEGWRAWKLGSARFGPANSKGFTFGGALLCWYFLTPAAPHFAVENFDFDRDPAKTAAMAAITDAAATDLSSFRANGGKLLAIGGLSDPVFSVRDLVHWWKALQRDTGGAADFSRLFVVPGMDHCGGGNAFDDFDPLTALEHWQERGVAPNRLPARSRAFPGREMPLCAYPARAIYRNGAYQCQ